MIMAATHSLRVALVGNPNCGKTALFNRLTGARQKVANYAGVTVDRKEGAFTSVRGMEFVIIDLPGAYSLNAMTPDEVITRNALSGTLEGEVLPDVVVLVADATNLQLNLRLVLEVARLKLPMVLVLNMMDVAQERGLDIDTNILQTELGIPVVKTIATESGGADALTAQLESMLPYRRIAPCALPPIADTPDSLVAMHRDVRRILSLCIRNEGVKPSLGDRLDTIVLHPILGYVVLSALLFLVFQAVFSWSKLPMDIIKGGVDGLGTIVGSMMSEGALRSLIVDGVLSGVGSVLVFCRKFSSFFCSFWFSKNPAIFPVPPFCSIA